MVRSPPPHYDDRRPHLISQPSRRPRRCSPPPPPINTNNFAFPSVIIIDENGDPEPEQPQVIHGTSPSPPIENESTMPTTTMPPPTSTDRWPNTRTWDHIMQYSLSSLRYFTSMLFISFLFACLLDCQPSQAAPYAFLIFVLYLTTLLQDVHWRWSIAYKTASHSPRKVPCSETEFNICFERTAHTTNPT